MSDQKKQLRRTPSTAERLHDELTATVSNQGDKLDKIAAGLDRLAALVSAKPPVPDETAPLSPSVAERTQEHLRAMGRTSEKSSSTQTTQTTVDAVPAGLTDSLSAPGGVAPKGKDFVGEGECDHHGRPYHPYYNPKFSYVGEKPASPWSGVIPPPSSFQSLGFSGLTYGEKGKSVLSAFPRLEEAVLKAVLDFSLSPFDLIKLHPDSEIVRKALSAGTALEARDGALFQTSKEPTVKVFRDIKTFVSCLTVYFSILAYSFLDGRDAAYLAACASTFINDLLRFDSVYQWHAVLAYALDRMRGAARQHRLEPAVIDLWAVDPVLVAHHLMQHPKQAAAPPKANPGVHRPEGARRTQVSSANPFGLSDEEKARNARTICRNFVKDPSSCPSPCLNFRIHPAPQDVLVGVPTIPRTIFKPPPATPSGSSSVQCRA